MFCKKAVGQWSFKYSVGLIEMHLPNPDKRTKILHKDGDANNYKNSNLEWIDDQA